MNNGNNSMKIFEDNLTECPACKGRAIIPWLKKYNLDIEFDLWRCQTCKTGFMNPRPTSNYLQTIYVRSGHGLSRPISLEKVRGEEIEYPNASIDSKRLVKYAKHLSLMAGGNNNLKALDIGSGYGFYAKAALEEGFKVTAVNPSVWENDVFESMNGFRPSPAFFEDLEFGAQEFHLVILSQVLEHLVNPLETLQKIRNLTNKNGILALAVPNVDSILVKMLGSKENGCLWVPEHLNYFSKIGLIKILDLAGFKVKKHMYVSRIPFYAISNRLNLKGTARRICNYLVRSLQGPPLRLCNALGLGLVQNVWAEPSE